ncbi:MAG TPA: prepilin-type N-terminal cleavage/methylation domain-containing protein, partial [Pirellulales bacterium]
MTTRRPGFTLIEIIVAIALLAAAMLSATQVLMISARQRRAADRRFAAQLEASNVAERIAALDYDAITPEAAQAMKLTPDAQSALPEAELKVTSVLVETSTPHYKRITIEIGWPSSDRQLPVVRFTTFRHKTEAG